MKYGLLNSLHLKECVEVVCDCLGYGGNGKADLLLLETAGAETYHGNATDKSIYAGMGITQIDKLPFQDIKDRCRETDKTMIEDKLSIDIDLIKWEDLRYNPLLCILFTRLKYKKVPEEIPVTLHDRASYWKKYYNTEAGKGTVEHYIEANKG